MAETAGGDAIVAALGANHQAAVILADAEGRIRFWNAGAEMLFGHAAADALSQRVDLVVPHAYREMHWAGFRRRMGTAWRGSDAWDGLEALHRDGSLVPLEFFLLPLSGADGIMTGVIALFRRPAG
jgi:PAS domain S-box-containing protein